MDRASTSAEGELCDALSELTIDPQYLYTSNDVDTVLKGRLREENLTEDKGIFTVASTSAKEKRTLARLLRTDLETNLLKKPTRILLVPCLTDFGHWVGVVVRFINNAIRRIEYYDSLMYIYNMTEAVKECVKLVYGENVQVLEVKENLITSDNGASCGPCTIENLINVAKYYHSTLQKPCEIRKKHMPLMSCTFPRCEYKTRYERTSAFKMYDPQHWNTYFRCTSRGGNCDRLSKKFKQSYTNEYTNKREDGIAKAGTIKSPWMRPEYCEIFESPKITSEQYREFLMRDYPLLYDALLEHKLAVCKIVVEKFNRTTGKYINVYCENDYPCVMVQIGCRYENAPSRSFYKIIAAYFTAITNRCAYDGNIPVEMVNRASFGHNIPSVAETNTSFRINVGLVPKIYADALADSLHFLNEFLSSLYSRHPSFKLFLFLSTREEEWLGEHNGCIDYYNRIKTSQYLQKTSPSKKVPVTVEKWNLDDDLLSVLDKKGDSGGHSVCYQITRKNQYIDLLTDYVKEELLKKNKNLAEPLWKILKKIAYMKKSIQNNVELYSHEVHLKVQGEDFPTEMTVFSDHEHPHIASDIGKCSFWEIVENINRVFASQNINILSQFVAAKKVKGLYSALEKANLEFTKNSVHQESRCGYGSDSDCEIEDEQKTTFYSKKVVVSTGMRAINLVTYLANLFAPGAVADTRLMYYETKKAIENVNDILQDQRLDPLSSEQKVIRYIDLNHCAAGGPGSEVPLLNEIGLVYEDENIVVFDYTSAKTERISETVNLIRGVPILLLVSSGIKNEQLGADVNPYGTIRIVARDRRKLHALYYGFITALSGREALPRELHNIRRAYKVAGAVVTSAAIYGRNRKYKYSVRNTYTPEEISQIQIDQNGYAQQLRKVLDLFYFNEEYKEEMENLTDLHGQSISEIVRWSLEKIRFLGSPHIKCALAEPENFSFLKDNYDDNTELLNKIISDINDRTIRVFDLYGIRDVFSYYQSREEELEKHDSYVINILDQFIYENDLRIPLNLESDADDE